MSYQKILCIETTGNSLRSEAVGWGPLEDGRVADDAWKDYQYNKWQPGDPTYGPVSLIPSGRQYYTYPTVLHAMGDGWRVMGPPQDHTWSSDEKTHTCYTWWLEKIE